MSYVSLALAKNQLQVIHAFDDEIIQHYLEASESWCAHYMNREAITDAQIYPWVIGYDSCTQVSQVSATVPKSVVQAVLLKLTDFYENRVPGAADERAVYSLLDQHRRCLGA